MTTFNLNGRAVSVHSPDDAPLLWVIRDEIGLKGTKFGCGVAQCGACTVHLEGKAIRSCVTPLAADWIELQVPQCGYCQSGQIMQAASLLKTTPNPTDAQIDAAMNGNLCRCMAYVRIKKAIKLAASRMHGASA